MERECAQRIYNGSTLCSVAEITGTASPHLLGALSESASVDLLMQIACRKEEETHDPEKRAIAKEIARKCYGVPLVVRTIGSLLFFTKSKQEWLDFKDYELPKVSRKEDCINSTLRLSYDRLPSHLKQYFALCSLFPKDYEIKKETLVDLWMAKGFIQPLDRSQHLEDIAHGYFMELLWRNFFQDFKKDPVTNEETYKMHDLKHDLACLVAGIECWVAWDDRKSIHERTRHISYGSTSNLMGQLPISRSKASPLRTFLSSRGYWGVERESMSEGDLRQLIQRFKRLRILELRYLPRGLGQLSSLHMLTDFILPENKALAKNCCGLEELNGLNNIRGSLCIEILGSVTDAEAESKAANLIGKYSLECLWLRWCDLDIAEDVIGNRDETLLDGLRPSLNPQELRIEGYKGESFPGWMADGSSLPNLVRLRLYDCKRCTHLPQFVLNKLKSLEIWEMGFLEVLPEEECLKSLTSLESLSIGGCPRLTSLSSLGIRHLLNLVRLDIRDCEELDISKDESGNIIILEDSHGGRLLHSLRAVYLDRLPRLESLPQWLLQASNLEYLHISFCFNLKELPEQIEALQSLQRLDIARCRSLTSLPEVMRRLTSLTHLRISDCPELEERCKREGGEDWYKIAHIPHIIVRS